MLKAALAGRDTPYTHAELEDLAHQRTAEEDAANKVERQVGKSAAALLLEARIGEQFDAIVTGASDKGTWARLPEYLGLGYSQDLAAIDPRVLVEPFVGTIGPASVTTAIHGMDLVVDGLDNFPARYALNDACVRAGLPWVHGAVLGAYGVTTTIVPGETPCLRCLQPELPAPEDAPTCVTAGVLGPAAHLIASLEAAQALRWLVTREAPRPPVMLSVDVWELRPQRIELPARDPRCPCCGQRRFEFLEGGPAPAGA